jgi:hypothetical protein
MEHIDAETLVDGNKVKLLVMMAINNLKDIPSIKPHPKAWLCIQMGNA